MLHPLNRLLVLFQAPSNVIKKRNDKLLDYDNLRGKQIVRDFSTSSNYRSMACEIFSLFVFRPTKATLSTPRRCTKRSTRSCSTSFLNSTNFPSNCFAHASPDSCTHSATTSKAAWRPCVQCLMYEHFPDVCYRNFLFFLLLCRISWCR